MGGRRLSRCLTGVLTRSTGLDSLDRLAEAVLLDGPRGRERRLFKHLSCRDCGVDPIAVTEDLPVDGGIATGPLHRESHQRRSLESLAGQEQVLSASYLNEQ